MRIYDKSEGGGVVWSKVYGKLAMAMSLDIFSENSWEIEKRGGRRGGGM